MTSDHARKAFMLPRDFRAHLAQTLPGTSQMLPQGRQWHHKNMLFFFSSDFVFHNKFWACQFYKPDFSKNIVFLSACVSLQQLSFFSLHISSITPEDCTQAGVGVIWVLTFTDPSVKECKFHDIPDMFIHKKTI